MDFLQVCKASHSKIEKKEEAKSEKVLFDLARPADGSELCGRRR